MAKKVHLQTVVHEPEDIFGGMGDFMPSPNGLDRYRLERVEVKPPTKAQRKKIMQRLIDKIDPPREVIKPPPPAKKAKPKSPPKPKKGKKVAKVDEVEIRSPFTLKTQWVPLVPELTDLLAEGWEIVDGDVPVDQAYEFLNFTPEEM